MAEDFGPVADATPAELLSPTVVVGAGLIGASVGCALTARGIQVHLDDMVKAHCVVAASRGAGSIEPVDLEQVKAVIVATPPQSIADVVAEALERCPHAMVTDTCSVKGYIQADLEARGLDISRYIGGHPMAGSHHAGPLTAASELFVDRTWVLVPRPDNPQWVIQAARMMVELTRARIVTLDEHTHDRAVAEISHMPQLMSSLTAARLAEVPENDLKLAGQGVRDMTRIAASDIELWRQIIGANLGPVREQLCALRDDLDRLIDGLDTDEAVVDVLSRGNQGVSALPSRRGKRRTELVDVVVEIPDTPGALAKMFADITDTGINIEDVSIEHDHEREIGYLSIKVGLEHADQLRSKMYQQGWELFYSHQV